MDHQPLNTVVRLGSDNERHLVGELFGDPWCDSDGIYDLVDTGETDVTCPGCLKAIEEDQA